MATLEQLELEVAGALLSEASTLTLVSWSEPAPGAATGSKTARVKIAQTDEAVVGSNLRVRTAEVVIEVWERGTNIWALETIETSINTLLSSIVSVAFWEGIASVRNTPTPELEVESEPERIGEVLTFQVRARVALSED